MQTKERNLYCGDPVPSQSVFTRLSKAKKSSLNEFTETEVCRYLLARTKLTALMLNASSPRLGTAPPEVQPQRHGGKEQQQKYLNILPTGYLILQMCSSCLYKRKHLTDMDALTDDCEARKIIAHVCFLVSSPPDKEGKSSSRNEDSSWR